MFFYTNLQYIKIYSVMFISLFSCKWYIEDANIGTSLGALFGGLVLGVILTTAIVMIMYRRSKKHVNKRSVVSIEIYSKTFLFHIYLYYIIIFMRMVNKYIWNLFSFFLIREEFKVTFADNETYSSAKVVDPNAIQTKNEKVKIKMCTYNGRRTICK